jgi:UDP-N-acetyl-D-mannosaminuronic acid transferase (WecB/TagA/CpsF family)
MLTDLQIAVGVAVTHGRSIDDVDETIIQPAPVSQDARAALWLYAWSLQPSHVQRGVALAHLAAIRSEYD